MPIAETPEPPYTAVIFTSTRTPGDNGYAQMLQRMETLAAEQPGYLGIESVKDGPDGITVSYWRGESDAAAWKQVADHLVAQQRGQQVWYDEYRVRVATVGRDYGRG
ncbi:MAG TPA: antibiotic biosynthesis monooxygenase [Nocardioides sp.]|jgi:heme-degrading monooxygenase HmoA|nr:antibiotic biosynthesis monooxygenase [Nocardioides sp.]